MKGFAAMLTYREAVAALKAEGAHYSDPMLCATADGYFEGANGRARGEYSGVGTARGRFNNPEIQAAYRRGHEQGATRRAVQIARGW
jgi:hypothetical protein